MAFAGLWETWKDQDQSIESFTIITTTPNELMAQLHNRMPVILDPGTANPEPSVQSRMFRANDSEPLH